MRQKTEIPFDGFDLIVISEDGETATPQKAYDLGIFADMGLMTNEGFAIGAPSDLEHVAFRKRDGHWKYKITRPDVHWKEI